MNVKKILLANLAVIAASLASCASKQAADVKIPNETFLPCPAKDDDNWFRSRGTASGSRAQIDAVGRLALTYAQDRIRQNMEHAYEGMVSLYTENTGGGQGTDIGRNTRMGGDQIIKQTVGSTTVICERYSAVDERGHVEAYVAVQISKKDSFDRLFKTIEDKVSEDEAAGIRFREQNYRAEMEKRFKQFRENN